LQKYIRFDASHLEGFDPKGGLDKVSAKARFSRICPCGAGALARVGLGKGTTPVVPNKQEKIQAPQSRQTALKKHSARSLLFLQLLRSPVNRLPSDGIIFNVDVAIGKAAPLPFSLLPRHPYRSRHFDQFVQFFHQVIAGYEKTRCIPATNSASW
jgi:hypothetical protein